MKILTLSTYDIRGGAAIAAFRIVKGLQSTGHESLMLVNQKFSDDNFVLANDSFIRKADRALKKQLSTFEARATAKDLNVLFSDAQYGSFGLIKKIRDITPDVIHIHWVQRGFLSLPQLAELAKLKIPIVWTLHDLWLFTGGCHYPAQGCRRFEDSCGKCPLLNSTHEHDLSRRIWMKKKEIFDLIDFTVTTPSKWLKAEAELSPLLIQKRIEAIPNSIPKKKYISQAKARSELDLDPGKQYVLFGAMDVTKNLIKGIDFVYEAFRDHSIPNTELLIFGNTEEIHEHLAIPFKTYGVITDSKVLDTLYAAADVTIMASRSENFPNTLLESFAQKTPCVVFDIGGMPEIVDHMKNGYVSKALDPHGLFKGVQWVFSHNTKNQLGKNGYMKYIKHYTPEAQIQSFVQLYHELID